MNKKMYTLSKRTGDLPKIHLIENTQKIKEQIVKGNLLMVRYDDCIIICNSKKQNKGFVPNIVLNFSNIAGDLILIGYDKGKKDFRSLNNNEVFYYMDNLNRKSFRYNKYKKWKNKINKCTSNNNNSNSNEDSPEKQKEKSNNELNVILDIQKTLLKHLIQNRNN